MRFARLPFRFLLNRWVLALWGPLVLLILLVGGFKWMLYQGHRRDLVAWKAMDLRSSLVKKQLEAVLGFNEVIIRKILPPTQKLQRPAPESRWYYDKHIYQLVDPQTTDAFYLFFSNGRLGALQWEKDRTPRFAAWNARWWTVGQRLPGIAMAGMFAWGILLLTALMVWRFHRPVGQILLAIAILCIFVSILDPRPNELLVYRVFFAHLPQIGMVLAVVSVVVMALPNARPRPRGSPKCHQCGYDLTLNESGICPECGTPIRAVLHRKEAELLTEIVEETAPDDADADEPPEE
jgi:hypothetical protein